MEVVTWKVLDLHQKPVVLVNWDGFFDSLLSWIETADRSGFMYPGSTKLFGVVRDIPEIFEYFDSIEDPV
jgi:predicted Rossmann-fold nucleotide-binding protein